ncbi:MAG: DUF3427 domain-containing protein [Bacilli bacterium]
MSRGVKGLLITSAYQNFTDVGSLEVFKSWQDRFPNFACHFDLDCFEDNGFHCKGYLFEYPDSSELIVGSSNITRFALLKNVEWDVSLFDKNSFEAYETSISEFNTLFAKTKPLTSDIIKAYQIRLAYAVERWDMDYSLSITSSTIKPNYMQKAALKDIRRYRDMGANKALIVAATGSGKTYLAAFDALNFGAKRLLYVVHRESILEDARRSFINVFGKGRLTFGLFTGDKKELDCDFIFATNSELVRHLEMFDHKEFDYIILDECHHTTSESYQKIIQYFNPEFMLGLTATPDRMDNQDVMKIFDNNIPYSLSIGEALTNDLIVPFHYYAIRDERVDYSLDSKDSEKMINQIIAPEHCQFVDSQIKLYRPKGKLKAIGFCRSVQHAMLMSQNMNELGYHSTYLTGSNDTGERLESFNELADDNNPLDIIFAVDILNEGVDIPAINMVLFLRPTQSQTIFIQQLGRGLRKYLNKDFLTVLDFIGNSYQRSVQIALALSSLKPNNIIEKAQLKVLVQNDFKELNLPIEIHMDEKSKEEVLNYIQSTNFNRKDFLINDYEKFKDYLRYFDNYPSHMDYLDNICAPDLMRFINSSINGSQNKCYYNFLKKAEEKNLPAFSNSEIYLLEDLSGILPLIRPDDYSILLSLLNGDKTAEELKADISNYCIYKKEDEFSNAIRFLQGELFSLIERQKRLIYISDTNGKYHLETKGFSKEFILHLTDLLNYGLQRYKSEFGDFEGPLKLYGTYTVKQTMMALNQNSLMYMKGTLIMNDHGYVYVGLKKDKSTEERLNYKDKFLSPKIMQWESETGCSFNSGKGQNVLRMKKAGIFVRKVTMEDGITMPFTYVGEGTLTNPRPTNNPGQTLLFDIILDKPIEKAYREDLLVPDEVINNENN